METNKPNFFPNIILGDDIADQYEIKGQKEGPKRLDNLSKVNLFVGANNSGKSRMLRWLFVQQRFKILMTNEGEKKIKKQWDDLHVFFEEKKAVILPNDVLGQQGFSLFEDERSIDSRLGEYTEGQSQLYDWYKNSKSGRNAENRKTADLNYFKNYTERNLDSGVVDQGILAVMQSIAAQIEEPLIEKKERVYIPLPRSLAIAGKENSQKTTYLLDPGIFKDNQIGRYFSIEGGEDAAKFSARCDNLKPNMYTGLDYYSRLRRFKLGGSREEEILNNYTSFLSHNFFQQRKTMLIPVEKDGYKMLDVSIDGSKDRPIYSLGDGVQAVILLTFPLWLSKDKPTVVFIEEPEINLHPGFQRLFMEVVAGDMFPNHQFFITTHSNHFLDLSFGPEAKNISIYNFSEISETKKRIEPSFSGDIRLLNSLGVQNSSVFLANCTIWVEGIYDRFYLKKYMELAFKSLQGVEVPDELKDFQKANWREDLQYSFVEYSGSNIVHWDFDREGEGDERISAHSISNRIMVIVDRDYEDGGEDNKGKRKEWLAKALGEGEFYELQGVEIENLLPAKVIQEFLRKRKEDEEIIKEIKASDYQGQRLGKYLNVLFGESGYHGKYGGSSGTIKQKAELNKLALEVLDGMEYEDLPEAAKDLTRSVMKFISEMNQ